MNADQTKRSIHVCSSGLLTAMLTTIAAGCCAGTADPGPRAPCERQPSATTATAATPPAAGATAAAPPTAGATATGAPVPENLSLTAGHGLGPARIYTLDDLRSLEQQRAWSELVEHLADVPPAARGSAWEQLAARASFEILSATFGVQNDAERALGLAEELPKRFPSLLSSPVFMTERARVGLAGFRRCYDASQGAVPCTERLLGFVQLDPSNFELAFGAGKLVAAKDAAWAAVPFFRRVVLGRPARKECDDETLMNAVAVGRSTAAPPEIRADAKAVDEACRALRHGK
jgi:hypothetical protein